MSLRGLVAAALVVALLLGLVSCGMTRGVRALSEANARAAALQLRAETAEANLARMRQAQVLGESLAARLATAQRKLATTLKERDAALQRAATGRTCFDTHVLGVLDGAPGLRVAGLAQPPGGAAAAGAAAAAAAHPGSAERTAAGEASGGPESTDSQVAAWMLQAGAMYETCRQRLDALIDFNQGMQARNPAAVPAVP